MTQTKSEGRDDALKHLVHIDDDAVNHTCNALSFGPRRAHLIYGRNSGG